MDQDIMDLKHQLNAVEGTQCEVMTRIVGYYRNVNNWNPGKKDEYTQRVLLDKWDYDAVFAGKKGNKNQKRKEYEARPINPDCPWG